MKRTFKKGEIFGNWTLISYLGGGGNGDVWMAVNQKNEIQAIKLLKTVSSKSYRRFIDEVSVIEKNSDIKGIIRIVEKYLPEKKDKIPFYVMPLAERSVRCLENLSIDEIIDAVLEVANTLMELHSRKIYHRDLKPANILVYNSKFCIADFGLVEYPSKQEISLKNEEIGAKWTVAPEMRRESSSSDLAKADIYSLSKTLWIFLTGKAKGFDGQYSVDSIIDLKKKYKSNYTTPIDNLLIACTDNDPTKRPTIEAFISELQTWKKLSENFHELNQTQWFEIQAKLFPASIPKRVIWEDVNDIIKVLKLVCYFKNLNHVFFPDSGGLDLEDVRISNEKGCIELDFQMPEIVKPKRLLFESFGVEHQWNYFRLELDDLAPTKVNHDEDALAYEQDRGREDISEISPGNYYPYDVLQYRYKAVDYNITNYSRHVTRRFKGTYVIFCKRSDYNLDPATYDARHNTMSSDEFRDYIQNNIDRVTLPKVKDGQSNNERQETFIKKGLRKDILENKSVYRCGWCGNIVADDGSELDPDLWQYNRRVIERFGDDKVIKTEGYCCKVEKHSK